MFGPGLSRERRIAYPLRLLCNLVNNFCNILLSLYTFDLSLVKYSYVMTFSRKHIIEN